MSSSPPKTESRTFIKDVISYIAIGALALLVFWTIWYLRKKFKALLILGSDLEHNNGPTTLRVTPQQIQYLYSSNHWTERDRRLRHISIIGARPTVHGLRDHHRHLFPHCGQKQASVPPPSYSSLFPGQDSVKTDNAHSRRTSVASNNNLIMERPPSYKSIVVAPVPPNHIDDN